MVRWTESGRYCSFFYAPQMHYSVWHRFFFLFFLSHFGALKKHYYTGKPMPVLSFQSFIWKRRFFSQTQFSSRSKFKIDWEPQNKLDTLEASHMKNIILYGWTPLNLLCGSKFYTTCGTFQWIRFNLFSFLVGRKSSCFVFVLKVFFFFRISFFRFCFWFTFLDQCVTEGNV